VRTERGSTGVRWALLLAAPLLWALHFALVYAAASVEITLRGVAGGPTRAFVVATTLVVLAAIAAVGFATVRGRWSVVRDQPDDLTALWRRCGLWLAVLSACGVLWQAAPALLIPGDPGSHHAAGGGANLPPVDPRRLD
jgi:hypothetical protein